MDFMVPYLVNRFNKAFLDNNYLVYTKIKMCVLTSVSLSGKEAFASRSCDNNNSSLCY